MIRTTCFLLFWFGGEADSPIGRYPPKVTWDQGQRPPIGGTWDQAARQEVASYRDPPSVNRMTDGSENITLAQTTFAGGKYRNNKIKTITTFFYVSLIKVDFHPDKLNLGFLIRTDKFTLILP